MNTAPVKHSIKRFPFIACNTAGYGEPNDRIMYRSIMQFKPDGGDRIRHVNWLREHKPEEFQNAMRRAQADNGEIL